MHIFQIGNSDAEHVRLSFEDADLEHGRLYCAITIKVDRFSGDITADYEDRDFVKLQSDLTKLHETLSGTAILYHRDEQFVLQFEGDGLGHITISGTALAYPTYGNKLDFSLAIDQSYLPALITQLQNINKLISDVVI